jgi:hypothetical protein
MAVKKKKARKEKAVVRPPKAKSNKEKIQEECARIVMKFLKAPQGVEGCSPAQIAIFRKQAAEKLGLEDE